MSGAIENTFQQLALSLANDYLSIYYLNIRDNSYVEYGIRGKEKSLSEVSAGTDFFQDTAVNCRKLIYEEDQERFLEAFKVENFMESLENGDSFSLDYRLMIKGEPVYYNLKTIRSIQDDDHVIIGVRNVDAQKKREAALAAESNIYNRIAQALASRYEVLYYVNIETDEYFEYSSSVAYTQLKVGNRGEDFFSDTQKNMKGSIYAEDYPMMSAAMQKDRFLRELDRAGIVSLTYRLNLGERAEYVNLRAVRASDEGHVIVAVSNIDASVRMERELREALGTAMTVANRDALTGVKSKHAYDSDISTLVDKLASGAVTTFGIGVFDVNGLKKVNDEMGHQAGDEYIRQACQMVCRTFKHSPVYRVGGDEFAVILQGEDFVSRRSLVNELRIRVLENKEQGEVTLACGIADYLPEKDSSPADVFDRADAEMYKNKKELKGQA